MATRLIIDGNAVYEIDEDCVEYQKKYGKPGKNKKNMGPQEVKKNEDLENHPN